MKIKYFKINLVSIAISLFLLATLGSCQRGRGERSALGSNDMQEQSIE